jgi:hypothetical protein
MTEVRYERGRADPVGIFNVHTRGRIYHGDDDTQCEHGVDLTRELPRYNPPGRLGDVILPLPLLCTAGRALTRLEFDDQAGFIAAPAATLSAALVLSDKAALAGAGTITAMPPDPRYGAGYRDGGNSVIADIRIQFDDAADTMDDLLGFFRRLTGDPDLAWPGHEEG